LKWYLNKSQDKRLKNFSSLPSIIWRLFGWCSVFSSSSEFFRFKLVVVVDVDDELLFPSIQAIVKPRIVTSKIIYVCLFRCFYSIMKCSGWFDRECTPRQRKKTLVVTICVFDDNYIPFFLFLSLFLLLFSLACFLFYRGREEKKIECVELFYWCTQRVGRPVCCNQQTNIIIWRACILYMERKRERNLTSSIFFLLFSSFCMCSFRWLLDNILICLKWWLYWIIYELTNDVLLLFNFLIGHMNKSKN